MPSSERRADAAVAPNVDAALERAFALVEPSSPESTSELHDAICAYVDAERARRTGRAHHRFDQGNRGTRESRRVSIAPVSPLSMSDRDALLTRAVTWCIERYYQSGKPKK
jgi:hypothetical protein